MTDLEKYKIAFADASIALEIAQGRYNETKMKLANELQKKAEGETGRDG